MSDALQTSSIPAAQPARPIWYRTDVHLILLAILAVAVRLPLASQSLWYDEMYTWFHYIRGPWSRMFGGYTANNHPLCSVLGRLMLAGGKIHEMLLRMPSVLAGASVGLVLAWPLRRTAPRVALSLALAAALQPWLAVFSGEARGYALMLLLGVIATGALPKDPHRISWVYVFATAAAVYTVPIAVFLCIGHGVAMVWLRRRAVKSWVLSLALAAAITLILYAPLLLEMRLYYSHPRQPSVTYRQFLHELWPHLVNGWTPTGGLWLPRGTFAVAIAAAVLAGGGILAWRRAILSVQLVSFAATSLLAILLPLGIPTVGEMRLACWLIPVYIITSGAILAAAVEVLRPHGLLPPPVLRGRAGEGVGSWLAAPTLTLPRSTGGGDEGSPGGENQVKPKGVSRPLGAALAVSALGLLALDARALLCIWKIPAQPAREALAIVDRSAAAGDMIIGIYLTSYEAGKLYPSRTEYERAFRIEQLRNLESDAAGAIWAVVFYPAYVEQGQPDLARYIRAHYRKVQTLPGRLTAVDVYRRAALERASTRPAAGVR